MKLQVRSEKTKDWKDAPGEYTVLVDDEKTLSVRREDTSTKPVLTWDGQTRVDVRVVKEG